MKRLVRRNFPDFDPEAKVKRILRKDPDVLIMSDGTFRVYAPYVLDGTVRRKYFAVDRVDGRDDEELEQASFDLLCGSSVKFFHDDDGDPFI